MKNETNIKSIPRHVIVAAMAMALVEPAVISHSVAAQLTAPSALHERSSDDLEKLAAPMALYPDPLIAVMLPASVYPVEIVQAARFVATNSNAGDLNEQSWDASVKAVASFPAVIQKMSDQLAWTAELGQAYSQTPLELMEAIQTLRSRAQSAGMLQTTPQQVVNVTQAVVERTHDTQVVYVTNTVVQITPANPEVIYVPEYNPTIIYGAPPAYIYDTGTPLISFGAGIAMGTIIVNTHPDWYYGGVYYGHRREPVWVGYGRGHFFPPPPHYLPPPFHPPHGHSPRPPVKPARPPGHHGSPPVTPPPRPPVNQPPPSDNSPRPPARPPKPPGQNAPPANPPRPPVNQAPPSVDKPRPPGQSPTAPADPLGSPANQPPPVNHPSPPRGQPQGPGATPARPPRDARPQPRNQSPPPGKRLPASGQTRDTAS